MRGITSLDLLEKLGKTRLSRHFFARDFLYSEIGSFHAMPNLPKLCLDAPLSINVWPKLVPT